MVKQILARHSGVVLSVIVLLGLALRVASAQGGLWLDEAWSAQMASDAAAPLAVFLNINHDNNHHLNSLWLQFVGFGAAPVVARALAIGTGTIAIWVAALIFRRRDPVFGTVAAIVVALSPILVTMGSEARGYAPMSLALLSAILLVNNRLVDGTGERVRPRLALCFGLGALSQLTMVFGCAALIGWAFFHLLGRTTLRKASSETLHLFLPALAVLAATLLLVFGAAHLSPTGFQFGRYEPFTWLLYLHALIEMLGYSVGYPIVSLWLIVAALALVVLARTMLSPRIWLYRLGIVGFPVMLAVLHLGNPGHPRYYLVAAIAFLLMIAEMIASALAATGWVRSVGLVALGGFAIGSLTQDIDLIRNQRGDPDVAVERMRALAPAGAAVLIDRSTATAMLKYSAAQLSYPLTIVATCRDARFLFIDRFKGESFPADVTRCKRRYALIAGARAHGLSGTHWNLYDSKGR